jgi:hypothetical protein
MPTNDDRIDDQHVTTALDRRHAAATPSVRAAIAKLAGGLLQHMHAGDLSDPTDALNALLGVDEKDQCTQRVVDWFLEGRRDNPPFPERPQFLQLIRNDLKARLGSAPAEDVVETLVNALAGAERDLVLAPSPGARMVIENTLVDGYVIGD